MAAQAFSIGKAIEYGWESFKKNPWFWVGATIIAFVIAGIVSRLFSYPVAYSSGATHFAFNTSPLGSLANIWVAFAFSRLALITLDGKKPTFEAMFGGWNKFINYLVVSFLLGVMIILGLFLLIVPGIILAMIFGQAGYLVLDKKIGPIEAFKESSKITKGNRWNLFALSIVMLLIMLVSLIPLGLGLLVTVPMLSIAHAYAYRKMAGGTTAAGK